MPTDPLNLLYSIGSWLHHCPPTIWKVTVCPPSPIFYKQPWAVVKPLVITNTPCEEYQMVHRLYENKECYLTRSYLMPRIEDVLDTLASATFLTTLDHKRDFARCQSAKTTCQRHPFALPGASFSTPGCPLAYETPQPHSRGWQTTPSTTNFSSPEPTWTASVFSSTWPHHVPHQSTYLAGCCCIVKQSKCTWAAATCGFLGHTIGRGQSQFRGIQC